MATSASNDGLDRELCKLALMDIANRHSVQKTLISVLVNFIHECIYCHSNVEILPYGAVPTRFTWKNVLIATI